MGQHPFSEPFIKLLSARNLPLDDRIIGILEPSIKNCHDPFLLKGVPRSVDRILQAVEKKERTAIFGHDDVDGLSAAAVLWKAFSLLRSHPLIYIPNREKEGHGLTFPAIEVLLRKGVELLITVDCGITSRNIVAHLNRLGVDCIVTDHHEIPPALPDGIAVIDPKQTDCEYPFDSLAGVGVSYKLSIALLRSAAQRGMIDASESDLKRIERDLCAFAVLGTISDKVPLVDENRIFVSEGLKILQNRPSPGLREAFRIFGSFPGEVNEETIYSEIVPLLSSGRSDLGEHPSCELLLTGDGTRAERIVEELKEKLDSMRVIIQEEKKILERMIEERVFPEVEPFILYIPEEGNSPLGHLTSWLCNRYRKPTFLLRKHGSKAVAEARYQGEVNLVSAIQHCADLLIDFGGHRKAAGFSIPLENIDAFIERIREYFRLHPSGPWDSDRKAEIVLEIDSIPDSLHEEMHFLAPFGEGNPIPVFEDPRVVLSQIKPLYSSRIEYYYQNHRMIIPNDELADRFRKMLDKDEIETARMSYYLAKRRREEGMIVIVDVRQ